MKKTLLVVSLFAPLLMGAPAATFMVDAVKQRYPWNGLVDVDYTVAYADGETALNPGRLVRQARRREGRFRNTVRGARRRRRNRGLRPAHARQGGDRRHFPLIYN